MKALVRDRDGSAEVVRFEDVDKPVPGDRGILVRVHATSLNAADLDYIYGRPSIVRLAIGIRKPRNRRLGVDVAGRVEAVGAAVTRFRPGDDVFADLFPAGMGALAEYVCARESVFQAKPASMSFEEAAAFPHSAVLALQAVRAGRRIRAGEPDPLERSVRQTSARSPSRSRGPSAWR